MLDKVCCWHKNPINTLLHLIALILILYGASMYNMGLVIAAVILVIIGHLVQWISRKRTMNFLMAKPTKKKKKR
ncbi:MAG TPA: hypothetical protein P5277_01140 [Candidatus Paceibacterota bacterium]|nr:hypothetical protein [Candidatus Paceibacterota bacterium]